MNSLLKQKIVDKIYKDWGKSLQSQICISIIDYVDNYPAEKLSYITYGSLRNLLKLPLSDQILIDSVQYLCGERVSALSIGFELIEGEDTYILDNLSVKDAARTGELIHPEKGDPVDNYKEKVFMFFEPGPIFKNKG